jgi:hypothetical protein
VQILVESDEVQRTISVSVRGKVSRQNHTLSEKVPKRNKYVQEQVQIQVEPHAEPRGTYIRLPTTALSLCLPQIIDCVRTLLSDWYNVNAAVYVPCSHCYSLHHQTPFLFPLDVLKSAAMLVG